MNDDLNTDHYINNDIVPVKIGGNAERSFDYMPSGPLQNALNSLLSTAIQYEKLADTAVRNASTKVKFVTNKNILSDFDLILIVDNHQGKLKEPNLLDAACDVSDAARKITAQYKVDASLLVAKCMSTLIPNAEHLSNILITLVEELRLFGEGGHSEKSTEEVLEMKDEFQAAYGHIQMNLADQIEELEKASIELALGADAGLKNLVDKLNLQMQVNDASN